MGDLKIYTVNVHFDAVATVKVVARSEDEALEKANGRAENLDPKRIVIEGRTDSCVTDEVSIQSQSVYGFPKSKYEENRIHSLAPKHVRELACEDEDVVMYDSVDDFDMTAKTNPYLLTEHIWITVNND